MKIVHVCHLYHPSNGGVQFFFRNVSERLVKNYGDDVTVVTTDSYFGPERQIFKKIKPAEETINGVKVIRFGYMRWHLTPFRFLFKVFGKLSIKKPEWMINWFYGPVSSSMKKYLLGVKAHAICASSSNYYFMQLPLWRTCNFFYFGSIHWQHDGSTTLLPGQVQSIKASTYCIANTHFEKARLVETGVQADKIVVLGVGVDADEFQLTDNGAVSRFKAGLHIPETAVIIGYVGRIEKTKNVILLVEAFAKVASTNANAYLLLAGSASDYVGELQAYCAALPIATKDRIKWQVNFKAAQKVAIFNAIDILVLPSHNEFFGIVFLEAWSCRKPVIGVGIGPVKDVITDGIDGLLIRQENKEDLVSKLEVLIGNEPLRTLMGAKGFEKVMQQYTWDIIVSRLRKYYEATVTIVQ